MSVSTTKKRQELTSHRQEIWEGWERCLSSEAGVSTTVGKHWVKGGQDWKGEPSRCLTRRCFPGLMNFRKELRRKSVKDLNTDAIHLSVLTPALQSLGVNSGHIPSVWTLALEVLCHLFGKSPGIYLTGFGLWSSFCPFQDLRYWVLYFNPSDIGERERRGTPTHRVLGHLN